MQWNWLSDITGHTWLTCIQWCQRTNFTAPGCIYSGDCGGCDYQPNLAMGGGGGGLESFLSHPKPSISPTEQTYVYVSIFDSVKELKRTCMLVFFCVCDWSVVDFPGITMLECWECCTLNLPLNGNRGFNTPPTHPGAWSFFWSPCQRSLQHFPGCRNWPIVSNEISP